MIRICQMLEKPQEIGDALDLVGDLGVVQLFHPRHYGRQGAVGCGGLSLLVTVHFSKLVDQFLDQGDVEALGKEFEDLLEHG